MPRFAHVPKKLTSHLATSWIMRELKEAETIARRVVLDKRDGDKLRERLFELVGLIDLQTQEPKPPE